MKKTPRKKMEEHNIKIRKNIRELDNFQIRNIKIMTALLSMNCASDEIIDYLREIELDYFTLKDKYTLVEKNNNVDEKTNVLKFREEYLSTIIKTASRIYYGMKSKIYEISLARIDIDNFSDYSLKYGHIASDRMLLSVSNAIRENSRPTDYVIRIHSDTFDVILPATSFEGSKVYMEKILNSIRKINLYEEGQSIKITASCGVSNYKYTFNSNKYIDDDEINSKFRLMQEEAECAMIEAKSTGKNRYCLFDSAKLGEYSSMKEKYTGPVNKTYQL